MVRVLWPYSFHKMCSRYSKFRMSFNVSRKYFASQLSSKGRYSKFHFSFYEIVCITAPNVENRPRTTSSSFGLQFCINLTMTTSTTCYTHTRYEIVDHIYKMFRFLTVESAVGRLKHSTKLKARTEPRWSPTEKLHTKWVLSASMIYQTVSKPLCSFK